MFQKKTFIAFTTLLVITATVVWLSISNDTTAAEAKSGPSKSALILVQNPKQIPVVLKTCEELLTNSKYQVKQARVLVCGQAVNAITADSENGSVIAHAKKISIQIDACGISLKKLAVSPEQLAEGVSHVDNALITAFELKADGWISIDL